MLALAVTAITAALVFYTIAVFWERKTDYLSGKHLSLFILGLVCDITGTVLMSQLAGGSFKLNFHGITGAIAILLMLINVIWALVVYVHKSSKPEVNFHKHSLIVWALWLIPYFSGMLFGMFFRH